MASMRHVLVVAGRTAVADELRDALLTRAQEGPVEFTLLLPAPAGASEAGALLVDSVQRLRAAGLDVAGRLGDADPPAAVVEVWDPNEYDEVLVATLPPGRSQWLADEVPKRIALWTGLAVEQVVAAGA